MKRVKLLLIIALFCTTVPTWAINLATWTFTSLTGGNNNWGPSPFAPSSASTDVTVTGLTRGSGIAVTGTAAANAWGGTGFNDGISAGSQTQATAIAAGNFITFGVAANTGLSLSMTEIAAHNIRISGSGPTYMIWQYSLDGATFTDIGTTITIGGATPNTTSAGNPTAAIPLSGIAALQNVASGTTITFRAVMWGAGTNTGTWYINGTGGATFGINGDVNSTPLSLDLISFKGQSGNHINQLDWITANEKDVAHFELQRGTDGQHFEKIAVILAKGNDQEGRNVYAYNDEQTAATAYYRLLMVNTDGTAIYSNVVVLHNNGTTAAVRVYPNPVSGALFLEGAEKASSYSITDVTGRIIVPAVAISGESALNTIDVSGLQQGVYFLQLTAGNNRETVRFVKQ